MRKVIVSTCLTVAFVLYSQTAMADTRIYVNLGPPVVYLQMGDWGPCGDYIWIEGCYRMYGPRYVWVPGYWIPAAHYHKVYVRNPRVHYRYHGTTARHGYVHPPQHHGNRPQGDVHGASGTHGTSGTRPSHGPRLQGGTNGTWINNIRGTVLNRQNRTTR